MAWKFRDRRLAGGFIHVEADVPQKLKQIHTFLPYFLWLDSLDAYDLMKAVGDDSDLNDLVYMHQLIISHLGSGWTQLESYDAYQDLFRTYYVDVHPVFAASRFSDVLGSDMNLNRLIEQCRQDSMEDEFNGMDI